MSTRVPEIDGEEISKVKSIVDNVVSEKPSITIEPLLPATSDPKSILVSSIPFFKTTPVVYIKFVLP
jgi:hypothetical protein